MEDSGDIRTGGRRDVSKVRGSWTTGDSQRLQRLKQIEDEVHGKQNRGAMPDAILRKGGGRRALNLQSSPPLDPTVVSRIQENKAQYDQAFTGAGIPKYDLSPLKASTEGPPDEGLEPIKTPVKTEESRSFLKRFVRKAVRGIRKIYLGY